MNLSDEEILKVMLAVLSTVTVILVTWIKLQSDKIRDIKSKLSDKKYDTYFEIIATLFEMINRQKGLTKITDDQLLKRMMDVKRNLLLYGNDKMVKKFFEWETNQLTGKRLWNWVELASIARKDMGNRSTKITADDILKSLLSEQDDYSNFKKELLNQTYK